MMYFPIKCFTLPLKLLGFPTFGVLILVRPNRQKWRHTVCTEQDGGQCHTTFEAWGNNTCVVLLVALKGSAANIQIIPRENICTTCLIANGVTSQEAHIVPVSMTTFS